MVFALRPLRRLLRRRALRHRHRSLRASSAYRAGSAASLSAAMVLAALRTSAATTTRAARLPGHRAAPDARRSGRHRPGRQRRHHRAQAHRLGHWQTPGHHQRRRSAPWSPASAANVVYPRAMRLADAQRFARDCDAHVGGACEALLRRPEGHPKVTALPLRRRPRRRTPLSWARPTYVRSRGPGAARSACRPAGLSATRCSGTRLAHVLAGSFGAEARSGSPAACGPARVPSPGLHRGASPSPPRHTRGDLESPRDWAKAMRTCGILAAAARGSSASAASSARSSSSRRTPRAAPSSATSRARSAPRRSGRPGTAAAISTSSPGRRRSLGRARGGLARGSHLATGRPARHAPRPGPRRASTEPAIIARRGPHVVDQRKAERSSLRASPATRRARWARPQYSQVLRELDPRDGMSARSAIARAKTPGPARPTRRRDRRASNGSRGRRGMLPRHVRDRALEGLGDLAPSRPGEGDTAVQPYCTGDGAGP